MKPVGTLSAVETSAHENQVRDAARGYSNVHIKGNKDEGTGFVHVNAKAEIYSGCPTRNIIKSSNSTLRVKVSLS